MPADPYRVADRETHDRLARLEEQMRENNSRLTDVQKAQTHLDECVDGMKEELATKEAAWELKYQTLKRWGTNALYLIVGMLMASGGGTISLKSFIEVLTKVK